MSDLVVWIHIVLNLLVGTSYAQTNLASLPDLLQDGQLAFLPIQIKPLQAPAPDIQERHLPISSTWQSLFSWPLFQQPKLGVKVDPQVQPVKQWTEDDTREEDEPVSVSLMAPDLESIDVLSIFDQVLVDDGHDRDSLDETNLGSQPHCTSCGCCSACRNNSVLAPAYNDKVGLLLEALQSALKETGMDPMPLNLKKTQQDVQNTPKDASSPSETQKDAVQDQQSNAQQSTGQQSDASEQTKSDQPAQTQQPAEPTAEQSDILSRQPKQFDPAAMTVERVHGILKGLASIKRAGDVKMTTMPGGIRMLRTKVEAGPLYLQLTRTGTRRNGDIVTYQTAMVPKLEGEMSLKLKRNGGIEVHSLHFEGPKQVQKLSPVSEKLASPTTFNIALRRRSRNYYPLPSSVAVAAQNLRDTLRFTLSRGI